MALNLLRNSRLFVTTVKPTGNAAAPNNPTAAELTKTTTWEIPVLSDFSFSQATETQDISLSEAGATPTRGSARFNSALNPVEWSFTTYLRPYLNYNATLSSARARVFDRALWAGLVQNSAGGGWTTGQVAPLIGTSAIDNTTPFQVGFANSNVHVLASLGMWIKTDNRWYRIWGAQVNQAEIDFSIEGIAAVKWSGFGTGIKEYADDATTRGYFASTIVELAGPTIANSSVSATASENSFVVQKYTTLTITDNKDYTDATHGSITDITTLSGTGTGTATVYGNLISPLATTAVTGTGAGATVIVSKGAAGSYASNSTTVTIVATGDNYAVGDTFKVLGTALGGATPANDLTVTVGSINKTSGHTGKTYTIPITGGNLSINNNITYLTPETLGVVNTPIGSFTGSREIMGSINAYMRTGSSPATGSGDLFADMLGFTSETTNTYRIEFNAGGTSTPYAKFVIPNATISIPSLDTQDVVSTTIEFKSLPYSTSSAATDITAASDMLVAFYPVSSAATSDTNNTD